MFKKFYNALLPRFKNSLRIMRQRGVFGAGRLGLVGPTNNHSARPEDRMSRASRQRVRRRNTTHRLKPLDRCFCSRISRCCASIKISFQVNPDGSILLAWGSIF
jgi:hypothetical protein